jgi:hypothetical protein
MDMTHQRTEPPVKGPASSHAAICPFPQFPDIALHSKPQSSDIPKSKMTSTGPLDNLHGILIDMQLLDGEVSNVEVFSQQAKASATATVT